MNSDFEELGFPLGVSLGGVLLILGMVAFLTAEDHRIGMIMALIGFVSCIAAISIKIMFVNKRKVQFAEKRKSEYYKALEKEGKSITRTIQVKNMEGTADYFTISKAHVKFSFGFSIFACIVGLVALGLAVWQALAKQNVEAAIVPIIGAAIAEFIAATVFWVHKRSAEQLNRYYDSLHEIEVFLSTTDMIDDLSTPEKKDEAILMTLGELYQVQKIKAEKETRPRRG